MDEHKDQKEGTKLPSQCCKWVRREMNVKNLFLLHDDPLVMADSQWSSGLISPCYISYRILIAILFFIWIPIDCYYESQTYFQQHYELWFTYATNWSLVCLALNNVVYAVTTSRFYYKQRKYVYQSDILQQKTSTFDLSLSVQWLIYNVAANSALVTTISYWAFIIYMNRFYWLSHTKHSINTAFVIVDLFVTATPIRILHCVYSIIMGVVYTIFYVIYFNNGGVGPRGKPYVYDVLRWDDNPETSALVTLMEIVLVFLAQVFLYSLYKLRSTCHVTFRNRKEKFSESFNSRYQLTRDENNSSEVDAETKSVVAAIARTYQSI